MQIRTRLKFNSYISLGLILLMIFFLFWSLREERLAEQDEALVVAMRKVAFDRILLRDEYLLNHGERSWRQWQAKTKSLASQIRTVQARFTGKEERACLAELQQDFAATCAIFPRIVANYDKMGSDEGSDTMERERLLFNQLLLKAYALTDRINQLQELARRAVTEAHLRNLALLVMFVVLVVMVIVVNSVLTNRILMRRIEALRRETEIIGGGDLAHRVEIKGDDELWDLARASNEMLGRLQISHTSIENLQEEIAARQRVEAKLEQNARELTRSNAELEQYAYVASHDLQEPLRMITSYIQLLERRHQEHLGAEDRLFMQYVVDGALRMQRLINDLLAYSRVARTAVFKPTSVKAVIEETIDNLRIMIDETGASITYDDLPVIVADGIKLGQLFQNLLSNAMKFHGDSVPQIHIGTTLKDKGLCFFVRDNGMGIDMHHAERVFAMFQRLQKREDYIGTGIGLAMAKKIVELHNGRIWFESRPGEGTTFYFTLPGEGGNGYEKRQ